MTQEQYYLNKLGKSCFKLPERPKPSDQNNNNYLYECLKLRPGFSQILDRKNCLSEFSMEEEKAEARSNLGITSLLEELSRQLDTRVLTLERAVVEQTPSEEEETQRNRVLSTYGLLTLLKNYYTKALIDEELVRLRQLINNQRVVDEELDPESTNPVQNKIIKDALDGIYDVLNEKIQQLILDTHREKNGTIIDIHQELDNKVDLDTLENYYDKNQVDVIKQNLQNQISGTLQELETLIQTREYINTLASLIEIPAPISDYNDLTNKPNIPTKNSDLVNDTDYCDTSDVNNILNNKIVILTESQYEALTEYTPGVLYFIVEDSEETENWKFGDGFPIILGDNSDWSFGQNFPITLK